MGKQREAARQPGDLRRLFLERANAGDAGGLAALYGPDAVLGFPPGETTVGREEIRAVCEGMLEQISRFEIEKSLPAPRNGDLALTSTVQADSTGGRVQTVRRQAD